MGHTLLLDPMTRDYVSQKGRPVTDTGLQTPTVLRLTIPRTRWMYAPDNSKYGSDFWMMKGRQDPSTASTLTAIAQRALDPLVDDKRALSIAAQPGAISRGGQEVDVSLINSNGQPQNLSFKPVGY